MNENSDRNHFHLDDEKGKKEGLTRRKFLGDSFKIGGALLISPLVLAACTESPEEASKKLETIIPQFEKSIQAFIQSKEKLDKNSDALGYIPHLTTVNADERDDIIKLFNKEGILNEPSDKKAILEITQKLEKMSGFMDEYLRLLTISLTKNLDKDEARNQAEEIVKTHYEKELKTEILKFDSQISGGTLNTNGDFVESKQEEETASTSERQHHHSNGLLNYWIWHHYMSSSSRPNATSTGFGRNKRPVIPKKNPQTGKPYTQRFKTSYQRNLKERAARNRVRGKARSGGRFGGK